MLYVLTPDFTLSAATAFESASLVFEFTEQAINSLIRNGLAATNQALCKNYLRFTFMILKKNKILKEIFYIN